MGSQKISYRQAVILLTIYKFWKEEGRYPVSSDIQNGNQAIANKVVDQIIGLCPNNETWRKRLIVLSGTPTGYIKSSSTWQRDVKHLRYRELVEYGSLKLMPKGVIIARRIEKLFENPENIEMSYSIMLSEEELYHEKPIS